MKKIFLFIVLLMSLKVYSQNWELKKNSDGIKVYTAEVEGSKYLKFKAVSYVHSTPDELLSILEDGNSYENWVANVDYSKLLSKNSNEFLIYYRIKMPVGFKDRDIVLQNTIRKDKNGTIKVELKSAYDEYPNQKKCVRIKTAEGFWKFEPKGEKTYVTFEFYSEPGEGLPSWLVNMFIIDTPFETLKNLQQ